MRRLWGRGLCGRDLKGVGSYDHENIGNGVGSRGSGIWEMI
jgi:hypothetical protein